MIEIKYDNITVSDGEILVLPLRNAINIDISISCPCNGKLSILYNGNIIKTVDFNGSYSTKGRVSPIGNINGGVLTATINGKSASVGIIFADTCTLATYLGGAIVSTSPEGKAFGVSTPTSYVYLFAVPPYTYIGDYEFEIAGYRFKGRTDGVVDFVKVSSGPYKARIYMENGVCETGIIHVTTSSGLKT